MLSSQIKSNEIVFGNCNKDLLEEIIFYGIGLGADFVEIFIENTDNSSVLAEEDYITSVSPSFGRGAGIRIFKEKKDLFDVIVTQGAGSISKVCESIIRRWKI